MDFFSNWGKNMHFPPFFHSLLIIFSPQPVIWPYFGIFGQTEKYTPLEESEAGEGGWELHPLHHLVVGQSLLGLHAEGTRTLKHYDKNPGKVRIKVNLNLEG